MNDSAHKIAKNSFNNIPMGGMGLMHKLADLIDHECEVKESEGKVLKGPNNVLIHGRVGKRITLCGMKFLNSRSWRSAWFGQVHFSTTKKICGIFDLSKIQKGALVGCFNAEKVIQLTTVLHGKQGAQLLNEIANMRSIITGDENIIDINEEVHKDVVVTINEQGGIRL
jgi:hypothetical protein